MYCRAANTTARSSLSSLMVSFDCQMISSSLASLDVPCWTDSGAFCFLSFLAELEAMANTSTITFITSVFYIASQMVWMLGVILGVIL